MRVLRSFDLVGFWSVRHRNVFYKRRIRQGMHDAYDTRMRMIRCNYLLFGSPVMKTYSVTELPLLVLQDGTRICV